jgi:hypothetical protein
MGLGEPWRIGVGAAANNSESGRFFASSAAFSSRHRTGFIVPLHYPHSRRIGAIPARRGRLRQQKQQAAPFPQEAISSSRGEDGRRCC